MVTRGLPALWSEGQTRGSSQAVDRLRLSAKPSGRAGGVEGAQAAGAMAPVEFSAGVRQGL